MFNQTQNLGRLCKEGGIQPAAIKSALYSYVMEQTLRLVPGAAPNVIFFQH